VMIVMSALTGSSMQRENIKNLSYKDLFIFYYVKKIKL
jgi:hypothetical protein